VIKVYFKHYYFNYNNEVKIPLLLLLSKANIAFMFIIERGSEVFHWDFQDVD